ncbi:hypothetical protein TSUD_214310 [Trifolium subterraneum]|uniref:F-box domain-containing protein n=1 Tax=Trifolium subterraneum TaxID=3900 RepID=A0A2Z6MUB8_TRISU|nr:hypothetical protein TSUD_214310 [Trifolium subterraneum]
MERKRGSIPSARARKRGKRGKEKIDDIESRELGPSFADLPFPIITDILLRLSTKLILICKRVCRSWNTLISDPHFTKLHFERSSIGFLIRTCDPKLVSRTMYLLEDELPELGNECNNSLKLEPTFKLPLRDAKLVLEKQDGTDGLLVCNTEDHRFDVVNSCNGLLCLCNPLNNNPLVVCNPITGEFIRLPKVIRGSKRTRCSGIGFQTKTNQYKVVRILSGNLNVLNVEINVVGTPTWMNVRVDVHVWIMKNDDIEVLWTKAFTLRRPMHKGIHLYWPFKNFDNGYCILEYCSKEGLIYCEPKNRPKQFLVCGTQEKLLEVIPHIPSLISLKDAVRRDNVDVLNVNSRCAKFKLPEE